MKTKQSTSGWIDLILFVGFLAAFLLSFTGVELHQWIGVIGGILAAYHLLVHRDWVDTVSRRIFTTRSRAVLAKFGTDAVVLAGFTGIIATGLVISTWLNLSLSNYSNWLTTHILVSIATLLALIAKLSLHWRWISRTARVVFAEPTLSPRKTQQLQPIAVQRQQIDRRNFLKVMGVVGGASLIAFMSATKSLAELHSDTSQVVSQTELSSPGLADSGSSGISQSPSTYFSTGTSCSIQCGKSCSYPGHCQRYMDENQDNRCDFGECA
jgi:hypothetical protein